MKTWCRWVICGAALALLTEATVVADAQEKRPVPVAPVQTLDGATVPLAQLGGGGKWILVYLTPASAASARLLDALERWQLYPEGHLVVVIADTPAAAAGFAAKAAPRLPGVTWAVASDRGVWDALQLKGVPTLIGAVDGRVDWKLSGVLNDPAALESVFRSWLDR